MLKKLSRASDVEREILELNITDEAVEYSHSSECRLNESNMERVSIGANETKRHIGRVWGASNMAEGCELLGEGSGSLTVSVGMERPNEAGLDEVLVARLRGSNEPWGHGASSSGMFSLQFSSESDCRQVSIHWTQGSGLA